MDFLRKLTSRKFLAAAAGIIAGISMVFGLDESVITTVTGAVTATMSVVSYIISEGRIDANAVANAAQKIQNAADALSDGERK